MDAARIARCLQRREEVVMKRRMLWGMMALPLALGLSACAGDPQAPVQPSPVADAGPGREGGAGSQSTAAIRGEWQLVSLQKAGQPAVAAPAGHRFSADFQADGRVPMVADCNRCSAPYSAGAETLEVGLGACTRAYCMTAPLDTDFVGLVIAAKRWSVAGEELRLDSEAGSLRFRR
jgi:heat shock protein HslJ